MSAVRGQSLCIALAWLIAACSFDPGTIAADAPFEEPPDVLELPVSCAAILNASPGSGSGTYEIDPDGIGSGGPLTVTCDMTSNGGGWTIVFSAPTSNLTSMPLTYTSATPALLAAATRALIAYRDSDAATVGDVASFPMPPDWRASPPFMFATSDFATDVSVNLEPAVPATVRYGHLRYYDTCDDPWLTTFGSFGRVCVQGTRAPFYSGFADAAADTCADSMSVWNSVACASERRFTIAVR